MCAKLRTLPCKLTKDNNPPKNYQKRSFYVLLDILKQQKYKSSINIYHHINKVYFYQSQYKYKTKQVQKHSIQLVRLTRYHKVQQLLQKYGLYKQDHLYLYIDSSYIY